VILTLRMEAKFEPQNQFFTNTGTLNNHGSTESKVCNGLPGKYTLSRLDTEEH